MQERRQSSTSIQSYTVEPINDADFLNYPPPPPVHPSTYQFTIAHSPHDEMIAINSTRLRNISVTLENTGSTLIKAPYLYGPHGYDFRDLSKLASTITAGTGLTSEEKFFRIHQWMDEHFVRTEVADDDPLRGMDGTLRRLNQYGGNECGENVDIVGNLLRYVPPVGSMYARKMDLSGLHQPGEAFWDGSWHNFDATPEARFIYYGWDNTTIIPGWNDLKNNIELVSRVEPWVGWNMSGYLQGADMVSDYGIIGDVGAQFDFNYDLRPSESVTMYFDMRGRVDMTSITYDTRPWSYRTYSDYGSAVFTYKPDLKNPIFQNYLTEQTNVTQTANGLIPTDPSKPASIVIPVRSTWGIAGADIKASFKTGGNVYIARNSDYLDTMYSPNITWKLLSEEQTEGYFLPSTIQGAMAYWLKFEFQGSGSGLDSVEIATEVTMSPWSMPGLEYGMNRIHFDAAAIEGGSLKVTYTYDDQADHHFYQPATANYGSHIWLRIGGVLTDSGRKQGYFPKLNQTPSPTEQVTLEITKVSGISAPAKVRTLINNATMPLGYYEFYWDGKDDSGNVLPPGMYAYRLTEGEAQTQGARLYLFREIWPKPNEIQFPSNTQAPTVSAGPNQTITLPASASLTGTATDDGLPAGSTLTVTWSKFSGPGTVTFSNVNAISTTASFSAAGTYMLRLTATDSELTNSADVTITVNTPPPTNQAPTVSAGSNQTITLPASANLNGTAADDDLPVGSTPTVTWSKFSGPGTVTFGNVNALSTTASFSAAGTYVLRLTATDSELSNIAYVTITVNAPPPTNQAPTVSAGSNQTITLPGWASLNGAAADDGLPAGSTLTVTWSKFSGPGTVTFGNVNALNTTASFSAAGTYVLRLTATDSELSSTADVTITVNPPPNQAPTVSAGSNQTITLPASASLNGTATDDGLPAGSTLTVTWSKFSGSGTVMFGNVNALSTTASFSAAGTYVLRLTATDSDLSASADVTIVVMTPAPPLVDAGPAKIIAFPSKDLTLFGHATDPNNDPLTVQWTLTNGPAPVRFSVLWGLATTVTFTTVGTYTFQLAASDGTFNVTSSTTVTVNSANGQTEFYVDPTYTGSVETGDAATPWKTLTEADPLSYGRWGTINAALAAGPVTIYFSARNADTDSAEEIVGSVRVRRTDKSTNRLTLDGMSRYNINDASPSWVDYGGASRMRIRVTSGCCFSIGWYSSLSGDGKLDYVTLRGFEVTGSGARITWGGSYSVLEYIWSHDVTTLGATIQFDSAVTDYPACADLGTSHDITIRNVLVERGRGEGIYIAGTYLYTNDGGCPDTGNNHNDILIEGNTVLDPGTNGGQGDALDLKAGLLNVTVRHNIFQNPHGGGDGITILGTFGSVKSNYVIEGNVIVNAPEYAGLTVQSAHGITIRNNVIYNSVGSAIQLSGDSSYSNRDVEIYNNTLYNNGAGIGIDHVDGIMIKNNLIFGSSFPGNYSTSSNITSDYNLWAPSNARWSEGTHSIIRASASGIVADPAGGDFRLTVGSPAIDTGVALNATGFGTDISGNPRPQGAAWDIGAYEFSLSAFPVITAITANVYNTGTRITWTTDKSADSLVEYGTTSSYGQSTLRDTTLVTSHSVNLSDLSTATTYHFRVKSSDAAGNLATSQDFTFTTLGAPTLAVSPPTLPNGTVEIPYNQTITASGSTSPYTFSVLIGALPTGLALNGLTGAITGTPTESGTASFSVQALDSRGEWGIRSYTMNVSTLYSTNVSLTPISSAYDGNPSPGLVGRFSVNCSLINNGPPIIGPMYFKLTYLGKVGNDENPAQPDMLLSADSGVGDVQTLSVQSLATGQSTPVSLLIGIGSRQKFEILVEFYAVRTGSAVLSSDEGIAKHTAARAASTTATVLSRFQFESSDLVDSSGFEKSDLGVSRDTGDIGVIMGSGPQSRPVIAVDPVNPGRIAVACNDYEARTVKVGTSNDGGNTWRVTTLSRSFQNRVFFAQNASLAFDSLGMLSVVYTLSDPADSTNALVIVESRDGISFTSPVAINFHPASDRIIDSRPVIAIQPGAGRYVAWDSLSTTSGNYSIKLARSPERGLFGPATTIAGYGMLSSATLALGKNAVYVGWDDWGFNSSPPYNTGGRLMISASPYGPEFNFGQPKEIAQTSIGFAQKIAAMPESGVGPNLSLAVDRKPNEVIYAVFADENNGVDIRLARSANRGDSWEFVTVNDDVGVADQFAPAIGLDSAGGVNITFYDTRMSSTFEAADVFLARSSSENSFENLRLTTVSSNDSRKNLFRDFTANLGDRTGIAMTPDKAVMVWTDTRLGTEDIFFSIIDVPPIIDTTGRSSSSATFAIPVDGGQSWVMSGASKSLRVGYARMQQDTGNSMLSGLAIFGYRSGGVLVTEASVPASTLISSGRIYVDVNGPVNTGIAFANANRQPAVISFYFTDTGGTDFGQGSFTLNASSQMTAFLNQAPFKGGSSMQGTFSFSSSVPVGVIAIRGFINERNEFLITTLPVLDIEGTNFNPIVLPQFADGGGWMTQTILTNPSNSAIAGYVQFFGPGSSGQNAQLLGVSVNGASNMTFYYLLAPGATARMVTGNSGKTIQAGSVRITPTSGTAPTAMAIFSFKNNGVTVSEATVSAVPPGLAFRMYTETSGSPGQVGSVESGLALTNPLLVPVTVNLDLISMDGSSPVLPVTLTVPGNGQVSRFVRELFPGLSAPFQGFLKVTAPAPIAVTGVRGRYNERMDFLITTTPPHNEDVILPPTQFVFPHLVSGEGYTTQFVIFGQSSSGRLWFHSQNGAAMSADALQPVP